MAKNMVVKNDDKDNIIRKPKNPKYKSRDEMIRAIKKGASKKK